MLDYDSSWDTLLKSGDLTQHPPYAKLIFTNTGDTYDWDNLTTWYEPQSTTDPPSNGVSCVTLSSGAVLWVGMVGGEVYEGTVASESALLTGDDSVTGWSGTGITTASRGRCHVWMLDGTLYLTVVDGGASGTPATVKIYSSASGNGGDWALFSTVYSDTGQDGTYPEQKQLQAGEAIKLDSGRWVMSTAYVKYDGSGKQEMHGVFTSDDNGLNWTHRQDGPTYFGGFQRAGPRRVVQVASGNLYWLAGTETNGWRVYKSTNDGTNWSHTYDLGDNPTAWDIYEEDGTVYAFRDGYLQTFDDLDTDASLTTEVELTTDEGGLNGLVAGDGHLLLLAGNGVLGVPSVDLTIETPTIKRVEVGRDRGMTSMARITIDNQDGHYSRDLGDDNPADKNEWYGVIKPGAEVHLEWGYGSDTVDAFTGKVGKPIRHRDRRGATLIIPIMGYLQWRGKKVLVTDGSGNEVGTIDNSTIEDAFSTICQWHGWAANEVHADNTGVLLSAIPYEHEEVYDKLAQLGNWVGYDVFDDESGDVHMRYPSDRQPYITGLKFTLNGTTAVDISDTTDDDSVSTGKAPLVLNSETVTDIAGAITYVRDTDYIITQGDGDTPATLVRKAGGSIGDGDQVVVSYAYSAWIFEPPFISISDYDEDPTHLVRYIEVVSTDADGNEITSTYEYSHADEYDLPTHSKRRYEVQGPTTQDDIDDYANYLGRIMGATVRGQEVTVKPWPCMLQVADVVQIIEKTSTSSELYRIDGFRVTMTPRSFVGTLTAHHYGYAAEPS